MLHVWWNRTHLCSSLVSFAGPSPVLQSPEMGVIRPVYCNHAFGKGFLVIEESEDAATNLIAKTTGSGIQLPN